MQRTIALARLIRHSIAAGISAILPRLKYEQARNAKCKNERFSLYSRSCPSSRSHFSVRYRPEKAKPPQIRVKIVAAPPEVFPEGFVAGVDIGQLDSVNDIKKAIKKKPCLHPT